MTRPTNPACIGHEAITRRNCHDTPVALDALAIAPRGHSSIYPQSVQAFLGERLAGRENRAQGDAFGLTNFGVNLTRLAPDAVSAMRSPRCAMRIPGRTN